MNTQAEYQDLVDRLRIRAKIRRDLRLTKRDPDTDRIADILEESANTITELLVREGRLEQVVKDLMNEFKTL